MVQVGELDSGLLSSIPSAEGRWVELAERQLFNTVPSEVLLTPCCRIFGVHELTFIWDAFLLQFLPVTHLVALIQ